MLQSTHNKNDVLKLSEGKSAVFSSMTNDFCGKKVFWIYACVRIRRKSRCVMRAYICSARDDKNGFFGFTHALASEEESNLVQHENVRSLNIDFSSFYFAPLRFF